MCSPAGRSLRHFLIKSKNGTLIAPQIKSFGPKNFKLHDRSKSVILAIFHTGSEWPCTVSAALKNPSQDFKILFALGADEFLEMLEGKIRVTLLVK